MNKDERRALVENAPDEVRQLLHAMCLLPARPGELVACRVSDLDLAHSALRVPTVKTGARTVPLGKEALAFFKGCARHKLPGAWLLARADGSQWTRFDWRDQIKLAAAAAHLSPAVRLYTLRHSTITDHVIGGFDLFTVAKVSGTSIKMVQDHYGHLQSDVARAALNKLAL